eukprot:gene20427-23202_t
MSDEDDLPTSFPSSFPSSSPSVNPSRSGPSSFPSSFPSQTPSLREPSSYPSFQPTSNTSSIAPSPFNVTEYPTSQPSVAQNKTIYTIAPSPAPHRYDIVEDITNPKKFNFVALALSLSLLLVVVAVTLYGFLTRYKIVKKKSKAARRYFHLRNSTTERMEMYFAEDVGSASDTNAFTKDMYSYSLENPMQQGHARLNTPVQVTTAQSYIQLPNQGSEAKDDV